MTLNVACQPFVTAEAVFDSPGACDLDIDQDEDLVLALIDLASDMLCHATGGVVHGRCDRTVRPVAVGCGNDYDSRYDNSAWKRRFGGVDTIPLRGPQTEVLQILIDGAILPATEYGLLDGRYLFRKNACWPTRNDLHLDDTQVNTWSIRYRFGLLDRLAWNACIELTCELAKDATGKKSNLPRGVSAANIQGAQVTIKDRAQALREGDEQIPAVARFLSIYAQDGPNQVSVVWSPELEQRWNLVSVGGTSGS